MNLLPMRYFITIAEQRSISRAAAELHVTQQTLSAHIAVIEQELSCCLFQRRPSFRLTYAGEVFLRYCRQFDTLMNAMQEEFSDISARRSGVLRIGITQTRGKILMPGVIREYRALPGYAGRNKRRQQRRTDLNAAARVYRAAAL